MMHKRRAPGDLGGSIPTENADRNAVRSAHRAGSTVFLVVLVALLLTGCDSQQWFGDRMDEADSLPPLSIASLLFGGNFINEELTCVSAGVLSAKGAIPFLLAAIACTLGVWVSDSFLYWLGVLGRRGLLDQAPLRWIVKREQLEKTGALFHGHGVKLVILSRFMPGSRVPIYLTAGLLGYPYGRFAVAMALAAVIWAPAMVWLSMKLGNALLGWLERYEVIAWVAAPAVIVLVWLFMRAMEWIVGKRVAEPDSPPSPTGE
jgi:membrane protein DedA with SNARE-associated domain